ncbi:M20 family peptidase [Streptomyces alfalfae]|uniref:Peptidase M20 domain-containing protein 2 n=1 Tax=Streptomyces alfalfae TaxID=1642299 RepID=A0ABN4VZR5_9ACTN|nr:amidohydrolase [Streptomyces alfalfae]AYA20914.1 M20 family peptidase [Streptomyces fradiae]APY90584.1 amidohydrolase [Streptomyces alfalfae]QUI36233.1 amidohydrolase [Streptomyces alfalfae]RXX48058.1 M20 family peptidase [Streptomyces alfalfae]RZN05432.1 M20 family peptidase [Streptomyces alfalfae]
MEPVYARVRQEVAARADRLWDVSLALHREPETAYEEHRAARLLAAELEGEGFEVERGAAGLPTAFVARTGAGTATPSGPAPRVALLMEYDALPLLGHACGHNLIAAAGLGAALAARAALGEIGGTLLAVGTPAEESGGGKVAEVAAGLFDGVDAALMFHPGVHDWAWAPLTASAQLRVGFHGRAAHPTGSPTEGVDALGALIQFFNTLGVLDRRLPPGSHVQGIVTDGGRATNIVPEYAEGLFGLRGGTSAALAELADELRSCARGVADATRTKAEVTDVGGRYEHFRDNGVLSGAFAHHLERAGIALSQPAPGVYLGSSDIGNVSTRVPAIHPFVAVMGSEGSDHTPEFARAAAGPRGRAVMLAAAEALACTAADVLLRAEVRDGAWAAFREKAAQGL